MYDLIRKLTCPFNELAKLVPSRGGVLDVGCGHGTFTRILAKNHLGRKVLGTDPSAAKIKTARSLSEGIKNISFKKDYLEQVTGKFDVVTVIDVLYLLPAGERLKLLKKAKTLLSKNGVLLVKTDSQEPRWLFNLLRIEEFLMVRVLKLTYSDFGKIYHLGVNEYKNLISKAGFKVVKFKVFKSFFPYRHPTYVAKVI